MPVKIIHLSDLHLGNDLVFRSLWRRRGWWSYVNRTVTTGLIDAIRELGPDFIVLSGDLVNKPSAATYRVAADYLRDLFFKAGFDIRDRLFVIPGNHDVSFFPKNVAEDLKRLRLYRGFLSQLFDVENPEHRSIRVNSQAKVIFACLDSTLKNQPPIAEGEIGVSQRDWVKRRMRELRSQVAQFDDYTLIAVLHHHCIPIAGTAPSGERMMQLLDAGDFLDLLDELGFHLVLHGHKHVPHTKPRVRSDSSVVTIIGAGTVTCAFVDEQAGYGNNFNLLMLSPENNELAVQVFKANQIGRFEPVTTPQLYPLFRVALLGYSARVVRKVVTLTSDGSGHVTVLKEGLRVGERSVQMHSLPLRIASSASTSRIQNFQSLTTAATPKFVAKADTIIDGEWVLNTPMQYGSAPVDVGYSYDLVGGVAMSKAEAEKIYGSRLSEEASGVIVTHPMETLKLEVAFPTTPKRFTTMPFIRVVRLGAEIPSATLNPNFEYDPVTNRCELEIKNPRLDHKISVVWNLPDSWP